MASSKDDYRSYTRRKILFIAICTLGLVAAVGLSVSIKNSGISFLDSFSILYNHIIGTQYERFSDEWLSDYVAWNYRLPRSLFAIIVGAALGVAGAAMQSVMHNPLADPYTTGISSGAQFGVSISMILGLNLISIGVIKDVSIMVNAFIFSLIPMILMVMISPKTRSNPSTLILIGQQP